ncbi:MAG: hypothetical protein K2J15_02610, partial [Muribaculaceae bacterium]|nr:hypothetical protein [Muribaculaceae bacterium]
HKSGTPTDSWLTSGFNVGTGTKISPSDAEKENNLFSTEFACSVSASENLGSERYTVYTVKLNGTKLERDVVILQEANKDVKYTDLSSGGTQGVVKIKLEILKGTSVVNEIEDYLSFINPAVVISPASTRCQGIQPSENGGRIRNLGLHMPMPNGGVTYRYTITKENGVTSSLPASPAPKSDSGTTIVYEFKDDDAPLGESGETAKYANVTKTDAIVLKKNNVEYTLDLYHTGFFHNLGSDWYYYEVMRQDDKKLWWLDRNIGATSAGMGVYRDNVLEGSWPIVGDKSMGGYYKIDASGANAKRITECPEGWEVPSYAQIRSLTTSANFTITRRANSGNNIAYFSPAYSYEIKEDGTSRRISSYFPQARFEEGGNIDGDEASGYYLTTTGTGSANWYQVMQFVGLNSTSQNFDFTKKKVSLRCCAGSYNPATQATTLECSVQGYTHVFLYYLNSDGSKTYLTTWPGEQVAVYSDIDRYHPFSLTTTVDYDQSRLYVIFNRVTNSGARELSNMSDAYVKERNGVRFVNGGKYTYSTTDIEDEAGVINGYWTTQVTPPTPTTHTVTYALRLPICDAELTASNEMKIVLVNKKADGSDDVVCAWSGTAMTKSTDNKYYYYKGTITIPTDKTPADYFNKYLFVYNGENKTTNNDVYWSSGKHSGPITDATEKAACGNPDYLYTVWAVSASEPTPAEPTNKKTLVVRIHKNDSGFDINWKYCYAWTSSSKWFGEWGSETPEYSFVGDYYIWKKDVDGDPSSLSGVILKDQNASSTSGDIVGNSITKESDATASEYGADYCYTVKKGSVQYAPTPSWDPTDPPTLYLIGQMNGWKQSDATYQMTRNRNVYSITLDNGLVNDGGWKINNGSWDKTYNYGPYKSNDNVIQPEFNKYYSVAANGGDNFSASFSGKITIYLVLNKGNNNQFDNTKTQLFIDRISPNNVRRRVIKPITRQTPAKRAAAARRR